MNRPPQAVLTLNIKDGEAGIDQTAELMAQLVRHGAQWPPLRPIALRIIQDCDERDFMAQVRAVFRFVQLNMKFVNDNYGVETLQSVPEMVSQMWNGPAAGDCDDFTVMTAALLKVLGFPVKIRVLKFNGNKEFSHVIPVVFVRTHGWIELDGTVRAGEIKGVTRTGYKDYPVIR